MWIIISTPTLEDYKEVVRWAVDNNNIWRGSRSKSIHEEHWDIYKDETCVLITDDGRISYSDISYAFDEYEIRIYNMEQFRKLIRTYLIDKFKEKFGLR